MRTAVLRLELRVLAGLAHDLGFSELVLVMELSALTSTASISAACGRMGKATERHRMPF